MLFQDPDLLVINIVAFERIWQSSVASKFLYCGNSSNESFISNRFSLSVLAIIFDSSFILGNTGIAICKTFLSFVSFRLELNLCSIVCHSLFLKVYKYVCIVFVVRVLIYQFFAGSFSSSWMHYFTGNIFIDIG